MSKKIIFWDFDGVIKETIDIKAEAFSSLFSDCSPKVQARIRKYQLAYPGVSRYEKIPIYLQWANRASNQENVAKYCLLFSKLVYENVLTAPWVPGVREYLQNNYRDQKYILVSATPDEEIQRIVAELSIDKYFIDIYGSPAKKSQVIQEKLFEENIASSDGIFIGDAETDYLASQEAGIPFLLRRTKYNKELQDIFYGPQFESLVL